MTKYNICVTGVTGRMGILIAQTVFDHPDCHLSGATVRVNNGYAGKPIGPLIDRDCPISAYSDPAQAIVDADCVIDFTTIEALEHHARLAAQAGANYMCGITGLADIHTQAMEKAAMHVPVFYAANTAIGVNLVAALARMAARHLSDDYDIHIHEEHHRHKRDAPSGTALFLGEACAKGRDRDLQDVRSDDVDRRDTRGTISFSAARGGEVVGNHTVSFMGLGERIDLTHHASNRAIYAHGAVRASLWLRDKPCGQYFMSDMLQDA
ncbi:MAG: 4-hydroxy-tetrahydrodipicolinate reductase [Pseudomonadota bacterium]